MKKVNLKKMVGWVVLIVLSIIAVVLISQACVFQKEMQSAQERLLTGSRVIEIASGPIEYADVGDGYPVLVVHGAGGGYDQGIILSKMLLNDDFRVIAPFPAAANFTGFTPQGPIIFTDKKPSRREGRGRNTLNRSSRSLIKKCLDDSAFANCKQILLSTGLQYMDLTGFWLSIIGFFTYILYH